MPLKKGNKTYKNFKGLEKSLEREGYSKDSAQKIAGKMYQQQEGSKKKGKKR